MRAIILAISGFLLLSPPASAAPTLTDLDVRLRVLEQMASRQDKENQRTREQAKTAAKSEADGVKETLSAQVQGVTLRRCGLVACLEGKPDEGKALLENS
ncbi:MAG: hypothetical protein H7Y60_18025 [Rhodospirillaceae bacterium]|nr:hypothetical protein [Rhodospirillales bacterium]